MLVRRLFVIMISHLQQIGEVIKLLRAKGEMAIVLVEQYFDFAFDLADQISVLKRGEVVFSDRKSSIDRRQRPCRCRERRG